MNSCAGRISGFYNLFLRSSNPVSCYDYRSHQTSSARVFDGTIAVPVLPVRRSLSHRETSFVRILDLVVRASGLPSLLTKHLRQFPALTVTQSKICLACVPRLNAATSCCAGYIRAPIGTGCGLKVSPPSHCFGARNSVGREESVFERRNGEHDALAVRSLLMVVHSLSHG